MLASTGPSGAWDYVIMHDTDPTDGNFNFEEFENVWNDIESWYPPCLDDAEMDTTGLS
jgi:hypothetical protein